MAFYTGTVVQALRHLHKNSILHRSIKTEAILVDAHGYAKLGDIGFAKQLARSTGKTYTMCGTPQYMSPEVLNGDGYGLPCDWWAVGVLLYELLVKESPFGAPNMAQTCMQISLHDGALPVPPGLTQGAAS